MGQLIDQSGDAAKDSEIEVCNVDHSARSAGKKFRIRLILQTNSISGDFSPALPKYSKPLLMFVALPHICVIGSNMLCFIYHYFCGIQHPTAHRAQSWDHDFFLFISTMFPH